jgi:hypothetical protein
MNIREATISSWSEFFRLGFDVTVPRPTLTFFQKKALIELVTSTFSKRVGLVIEDCFCLKEDLTDSESVSVVNMRYVIKKDCSVQDAFFDAVKDDR